ncbi:MAG: HEAT repeat domain-containing protein [Synechococcales bacterium]|nr:HEAT repeat domain-containing protein [Synechococcales bacterium]
MDVTPESVKTLLESEDYGDRLSAVNQMRYLDVAAAFELIQLAIADINPRVRYAAVSQLSSLGSQNIAATERILRNCLLRDADPDVRAAAADSVGALKLTSAFDDLQVLYGGTSEWLVKFSIVAALGELGDPRGFEILEDAITSDNELIRTVAIGSLGELGDRRAIPILISYASSDDWQIRHRVAQALSRIGGTEVEPTLQTLAADTAAPVAQEAKSYLTGH